MFHAVGYRFLPEVGTLNLDISRENRSISHNREKMEILKEYIRAHDIDTLIHLLYFTEKIPFDSFFVSSP